MTKLDELLCAPPPPAYEKVAKHRVRRSLPCGFDASIWLSIFSALVDPRRQSKEEQAIAWATLHRDVRFVCKDFYLICMHLLRSRFLQRYMDKIRAPYTSDPYPTGQVLIPSSPSSSLRVRPQLSYATISAPSRSGNGAGRETRILDLFVAASVRSDFEAFESCLLESTFGDDEQGESDLFTVHQPRSRLEDLVIALGRRRGVIRRDIDDDDDDDEEEKLHEKPSAHDANRRRRPDVVASIDAHDLAIELRGRSASLRIRSAQSTSRALRTMFEVARRRDDSLESTADHIVAQLYDRSNA